VCKANTEPDIMGYRLFRANAPHEEFISLSREVSTVNRFSDTINLNTLTHKIYYKLVAVDKHYNNSEYSAALELTRPDTVCPAPATIIGVTVKENSVNLQFEESPSADISHYELFLTSDNDSVSFKIADWKKSLPPFFEDATARINSNLIYSLKTIDLSGNTSAFYRKVTISRNTKNTIKLKVEQIKNGKSIKLYWEIPESKKPVKITIYKGIANEPLSIYKTLEGFISSFEDVETEIGTNYKYKIRILLTTGEVLLSDMPASIVNTRN